MKRTLLPCAFLLLAQFAHADVYVLEADNVGAKHHVNGSSAVASAQPINAHIAKPGEKSHGLPLNGVHPNATGSISLIDSSGLKYFINTNITFSTSSSASGAMSEADYTHAVAATTMNGGNTNSTLDDAFDGYGAVCFSLSGATGPCETGNASYTFYNKNGPATTECNGRQVDFPTQTIEAAPVLTEASNSPSVAAGGLSVSRKVYVPTDDTFARTLNIMTNTGGSSLTFNMITSNNLGSDNNTVITATSSGSPTVSTADNWAASFQNYSGTTTSDPRLGFVFQSSTGVSTPMSFINFVNGDDNPYWGYTITLAPGQTKSIMTFVTGQPSKAAAAAQAARLTTLPDTALECLTTAERAQITNFRAAVAPVLPIPSLSPIALAWLALGLAVIGGFITLRRRA